MFKKGNAYYALARSGGKHHAFARKGLKYLKYVSWTQPVLYANGTMGGNQFACNASSWQEEVFRPYKVFDYDTEIWASNGAPTTSAPQWISWYNPVAMNITKLLIRNRLNSSYISFIGNATFQGSNNNQTWENIKSFSNTNNASGAMITVDCSNNVKRFKYHRLYITSRLGSNNWVNIDNIALTARILATGTADDYDVTEPAVVYY